jgi:hypothetical protein
MITNSDITNELKKYVAFFNEKSISSGKFNVRTWTYGWDECEILCGKTVVEIYYDYIHMTSTGIIYDYSAMLGMKINTENYKDIMNSIKIHSYDFNELTTSQMKIILENNAKVANVSSKLNNQVERYKNLEDMF